jgi:hypothetical protein
MNHTSNTLPRGLILCTDRRLSRLLETELAYLGIIARAAESVSEPDGELCLLVADGDAFPVSDCLELAEACSCPLLLFGREVTSLPPDRGVFLRRPFALDRLENAARGLVSPTASPLWAMAAGSPIPPSPAPEAPATEDSPAVALADGVLSVLGKPIPLTPAEAAILDCLYTRRGEAVSREELSALLGGGGNSVEVYICKLRAKIEKPLGRRMIVTVRGEGYRLDI